MRQLHQGPQLPLPAQPVVVRGKQAAAAPLLRQPQRHAKGNGVAVVSGGASAHFIQHLCVMCGAESKK